MIATTESTRNALLDHMADEAAERQAERDLQAEIAAAAGFEECLRISLRWALMAFDVQRVRDAAGMEELLAAIDREDHEIGEDRDRVRDMLFDFGWRG